MIEIEYEGKKVSLRACPFCGSDPLVHSYKRRGALYIVRCSDERGICRMMPQTLSYRDLEQAAADWNMRLDDVPNLDTREG